MGAAIIIVMDDAVESLDVSGSLLRGTLFASLIIALILVLFMRRDALPELKNFLVNGLKTGFGWVK